MDIIHLCFTFSHISFSVLNRSSCPLLFHTELNSIFSLVSLIPFSACPAILLASYIFAFPAGKDGKEGVTANQASVVKPSQQEKKHSGEQFQAGAQNHKAQDLSQIGQCHVRPTR